jgi:hypothetical protein
MEPDPVQKIESGGSLEFEKNVIEPEPKGSNFGTEGHGY